MTMENRLLSIDVECVATGFGHDARSPCSVAIVDDRCEILFQSLIKPTDNVVSDLFPLSGVRIKDLENAPILDDVLKEVHRLLSPSTIIVGQQPKNDLQWLKLEKGIHYGDVIDISEWFASYNARYRSYSHFSLAHEAFILLNIDLNAQQGHLATQDAKAAMQLYLKYKDNEQGKIEARQRLSSTRPRVTPAKACNYKYEGVCLAGFFRQMCSCGRPLYNE